MSTFFFLPKDMLLSMSMQHQYERYLDAVCSDSEVDMVLRFPRKMVPWKKCHSCICSSCLHTACEGSTSETSSLSLLACVISCSSRAESVKLNSMPVLYMVDLVFLKIRKLSRALLCNGHTKGTGRSAELNNGSNIKKIAELRAKA